ncbi:RICIN domain-containing protein [Saccharothrix saharensis]|uniref:RICIN domain-containing protein n=1 Tax=Saccharothrix saharensis TaxID=571190 RepID=UPI00368189CF
MSQSSGRYLDIPGSTPTNGALAQIWDCNSKTNQQFRLNCDGSVTAVASGKCLDVNGGATANGTNVIIWDCHGGTNQRWTRT